MKTTSPFVQHATLLVMMLAVVDAFQTPIMRTTSSSTTRLWSAVAPPDVSTTPVNGQTTPTAWECDEEANCEAVPACNDEMCRTSLDVRIHNTWYDLSGWRKAHPAGAHWIDWYDGRDATEVMDGFHSQKGRSMYQRLPQTDKETAQLLESSTVADTSTQIAFRKLRNELEEQGWWERDAVHEATQLGIWAALVGAAVVTAPTIPIVSTILLALSMTAAGWLGHDYIHGIDPLSDRLRLFAPLVAGLSPTWWSDKHNKHHALTNEQGCDEDIATDPFIYIYPPDPSQDSPLRKIQHYVFWIPFSFLFALWRFDSINVAVKAVEEKRTNAKTELYCFLVHYIVLLSVFPVHVWLPAIFISGFLTATIVTPTHQSEELFEDYQSDWVTQQFQSTRNAVTTNPFSEWIWGGMQYQLQHHLFPSMPRHQYPKLRERLIQFAKDNQVPGGYRESNEFDILKMNWELYQRVAQAQAIPGAPLTRGRRGQQGAIVDDSASLAAE